jgi:uncharacterized damage-inducible protein DinB
MGSLDRFGELFDYDLWANRLAIQSVEAVGEKSEGAIKVLGHLIGAQRVWLARFRTSDPPSAQPWPNLSLAEAGRVAEELHWEWREMFSAFSAEWLDENLIYRNTKGAEFKMPVRDVLTHLLMHSAYHRGQIALAVRAAGGTPAATDYVVYARRAK